MGKGGGGGTQSTQTVQKADPWSGQQPHLQRLYSEAENLYNQGGPGYFPGQTLAPVSPYTTDSIQAMASRAQAGSPVQQGAMDVAQRTLAGDYLSPDSNPWLKGTYDEGARQVESSMRGAWGGSDAVTGSSGLQQAALGTSLSDLANNIYGGNYQQERGRQAATMAMAPQLAGSDYADIGALGQAGDAERGLAQQGINDQIQKYNYEQNLPYLNLGNYGQMISGSPGGTQTTTGTQPLYGSGLGGLGGALTGAGTAYGLGSMLGPAAGFIGPPTAGSAAMGALAGPWGLAGGALLGGLLGK